MIVAFEYNFLMADIPLYDESEEVPAPRARQDVRFTTVAVKPYPDGRRVKLSFALTPFEDRPSVDMDVTNVEGREVASLSLIEAMDTSFDFTVHLRGPEPRGEHVMHLSLFYLESDEPEAARQVVDEHRLTFFPAPEAAA
jgi:hypothetical protein